jgi:hypothetical protein
MEHTLDNNEVIANNFSKEFTQRLIDNNVDRLEINEEIMEEFLKTANSFEVTDQGIDKRGVEIRFTVNGVWEGEPIIDENV